MYCDIARKILLGADDVPDPTDMQVRDETPVVAYDVSTADTEGAIGEAHRVIGNLVGVWKAADAGEIPTEAGNVEAVVVVAKLPEEVAGDPDVDDTALRWRIKAEWARAWFADDMTETEFFDRVTETQRPIW